jgi:hypothetical protein
MTSISQSALQQHISMNQASQHLLKQPCHGRAAWSFLLRVSTAWAVLQVDLLVLLLLALSQAVLQPLHLEQCLLLLLLLGVTPAGHQTS